jgi:DNA-binding transcriptional regulator GbsR (MarR family)
MKDVWEMFNIVVEERKRREVDPTLAMLRASVAELESSGSTDTYTRERLREMLDFFETMTSFYAEIRRLPAGTLRQAARLRGKVRKVLGFPAAS